MAIGSFLRGEEGEWYADKVIAVHKQYLDMPATYEQDGKGDDAIIGFHMFWGGVNIWVLERDKSGIPNVGYDQCFGYTDLGYGPELGYVSLVEAAAASMDIDLHWEPITVREWKKRNESNQN